MQQKLFDDVPERERGAANSALSASIPALTLTQPWASLVAIGAKRIETRSWGTRYRGPIAIHAAKRMSFEDEMQCFFEPFNKTLRTRDILSARDLPLGAVLAIGRLVDCQKVGEGAQRPAQNSLEFAFGDFSWGRWLWYLDDVEELDEPLPARGALGLWEWRPD
ncbi:MAG TPA: ASCH domain-containing protein [Chloroflexota bacterium]